jgi:hypothetical protein
MEKSGQRRKEAEAGACPLGFNHACTVHCRFLLKTDQLLGWCSYKAMPSTRYYMKAVKAAGIAAMDRADPLVELAQVLALSIGGH